MAMRHELKWLDSMLGPLRNVDVTLVLLTQSLSNVTSISDSTTDQFMIRLIDRLNDQRQVHVDSLHEQLHNGRLLELMAGLSSLATEMPIRKNTLTLTARAQVDAAMSCLEASQHKLLELAQESIKNPSRQGLHQVRIQAKRVRYLYTADQQRNLVSDNTIVVLATELHKLLGKHQDIAMLEAWLKKQETDLVNETLMKSQWLVDLKYRRAILRNKYLRILDERPAIWNLERN